MSINFKSLHDEFLFVPLGGTDEIGNNMYLYHYKGKWLIVDLGIGFADEFWPGIEIIVPDISFLNDIKKDIVGIFVTHAHEDHVGAIHYLWHELKLPIYCTKFTAAVLKNKLTEVGLQDEAEVNIVRENSNLKVGPFDIQLVGLTHSVPEMQALAFRTEKGIVFHTGDWKFDDNPIVGKAPNYDALKALGDEGVSAMICDSTNIFNKGVSGSEGDLKKSIGDLIKRFDRNMIIVSTFASNLARVHTICKSAEAAGRKVAFAGKSLWRMYQAAKDTGYLQDIEPPLTTKDIMRYPRNQILVIATGCQGEWAASVPKIARGDHPDIKLIQNDIIIFASKIIPGNETKIFDVFNKLVKLKAEVITEKDHFVHVSGHPSLDEISRMYDLIRPKCAIPVHGEPMHTHEHCHVARHKGVKKAVQVENGAIVRVDGESSSIIGKVPTGYLGIDGNFLLPSDSEVLRSRRRMKTDGLVVVTLTVNKRNKLLKSPLVIAPGVLDSKEDSEIFERLIEELIDYVDNNSAKFETDIENGLRSLVKKFFYSETAKQPKIYVQLQKVAV